MCVIVLEQHGIKGNLGSTDWVLAIPEAVGAKQWGSVQGIPQFDALSQSTDKEVLAAGRGKQ